MVSTGVAQVFDWRMGWPARFKMTHLNGLNALKKRWEASARLGPLCSPHHLFCRVTELLTWWLRGASHEEEAEAAQKPGQRRFCRILLVTVTAVDKLRGKENEHAPSMEKDRGILGHSIHQI